MLKKIRRSILDKIIKMEEHTIIAAAAVQLHQKTFLPYKNYCDGQSDIVVCGAGPTLKDYIPIENAIHIAVNRSFLFDKINFDFIFAQDMDGIKMVQKELIEYRREECVKFLGIKTEMDKKSIPESLANKCNARRFYMDYFIYGDGFRSKLVNDIDLRPLGGMPNVGMSVMQLAMYMNPRRLYIVGCDMSGNHFAIGDQNEEEVKTEGRAMDVYWEKEHKALLSKWKEIKEFADIYYPDTKIIVINPVGLKGVFTDIYQK